MTPDQIQTTSPSNNRQKLIAGIFVIVILIIGWQLYGLLKGNSGTTSTKNAPALTKATPSSPSSMGAMHAAPPNNNAAMRTGAPMMPAGGPMMPQQQQLMPQPAQLAREPAAMTQQEANMLKMQQQIESQYLYAVNQLQILKVERDIAETNKAIMSAKLDMVTAQKGIVTLLQPPAPPVTPATYSKGLVNPTGTTTTTVINNQQPLPPAPITSTPEVNYAVISVSRLQNHWSAVLGYQGNLFSVSVGDILPPDGSRVASIGRTGVLLQKNGIRKKISLVPII